MGQREIATPVVVVIIVILVIVTGAFLYKGVTGGTVGDGREGHVQASPPMPVAARNQMLQQAQMRSQHGSQPTP